MAKTDWGLNDIVRPADLNNIGEDINQLREDVDNMDFPLSDATDGTRSDVAGSEKAVGLVMAEAQAAKMLGNERKQEVVDALIALGVTASTSDSWDTLISKMSAIIKATGNATAADVRDGKTFSNANGNGLQGAIPVRATGATTVNPSASAQKLLAGIYDGDITINPGTRIAQGVGYFALVSGNTYVMAVTSLAFRPSIVICKDSDGATVAVYVIKNSINTNAQFFESDHNSIARYNTITVTENGFTFTQGNRNTSMPVYWIALA